MRSRSVRVLLVVSFCVAAAQTALGSVPGSMEITCDVDRRTFRTLARNETQVTFRLWDAQTGGAQCGLDHVKAMSELLIFNSRSDRFDAQKPRRFASIRATLGSDATPIQLCPGAESWLDVQVGATTLTCAFSEDPDAKNPPPPPARKRLHSVPSAQTAQPTDISARVFESSNMPVPTITETPITFDTERWDTDNIHCTGTIPDQCTLPDTPTRLTARTAGKYLIFGHIEWPPNSVGVRQVHVRLNGTTNIARVRNNASTPSAFTGHQSQSVSTHYQLNAGDYVELVASQDSGSTLNVELNANLSPEFGIVKLP